MLLDILCKIMVSILTNNIALTLYMSPMRRDIFCGGRISNFTFPQSILRTYFLTAEIYAGAVRTVVMAVRTGNCTIGFSKNFAENLSCLRAASGRKTQSSGRLHIRCKYFPYKASRVRTMGDERPDG